VTEMIIILLGFAAGAAFGWTPMGIFALLCVWLINMVLLS